MRRKRRAAAAAGEAYRHADADRDEERESKESGTAHGMAPAGATFWFLRNRLFGSYFALILASRS